MEDTPNGSGNGIQGYFSTSFGSQRHVFYSCGSCGFDLNLNSSNRNTSTIGSKYGKSIRRGMISFFQIDESRFTLVDELSCTPYFNSKSSWGLFKKKTKLLCRKCGNRIGSAYVDKTQNYALVAHGLESNGKRPVKEEAGVSCRKFDIRIRALQPSSSDDQAASPLFS